MKNEWILDVLADLKTFATQNGLGLLAEHLDDTRLVAAAELASTGEGRCGDERGPAQAAGRNFGGVGKRL